VTNLNLLAKTNEVRLYTSSHILNAEPNVVRNPYIYFQLLKCDEVKIKTAQMAACTYLDSAFASWRITKPSGNEYYIMCRNNYNTSYVFINCEFLSEAVN